MRVIVRRRPRRAYGLLVVVGMAAACVGDTDRVGDTELPAGTTTSQTMIRLFAENCVHHFPNPDASARAFLEDGFVEVGDSHAAKGFWSLARRSDGLWAQTGPSAEGSPASGMSFEGLSCLLIGDLSDPDRFAAELLKVVDRNGEPVRWSREASFLLGIFERQGATWELSAGLPDPDGVPWFADTLDACGEGAACDGWGAAQLHIQMRDPPR